MVSVSRLGRQFMLYLISGPVCRRPEFCKEATSLQWLLAKIEDHNKTIDVAFVAALRFTSIRCFYIIADSSSSID